LDSLLALLLIRTCCAVGLSSEIKRKMFFNLILDFVIGLVPLLGDIADAVYKCNTKNFTILEKELNRRGNERLRAKNKQELEIAVDPEDGAKYDGEQDLERGPSPPEYTASQAPAKLMIPKTLPKGKRVAERGVLGTLEGHSIPKS
jgi:hypothetical protein